MRNLPESRRSPYFVFGILMIIGTKTLEGLLLDDVVGAIPVHLVGGVWGTLAVCLTNPEVTLATQLLGAASIGAFTFCVSYIVWLVLRRSIGIRLKRHHEHEGGDLAEIGMRAYNLN